MQRKTLAQKMILLGMLVVTALLFLGGLSLYTNRAIKASTTVLLDREKQLELTSQLLHDHLALLLAAMDVIVDKDQGQVAAERLATIKKTTARLESGLQKLTTMADNDQKRATIDQARAALARLKQDIQVELVRLVESRGSAAAFAEIDDRIDADGGRLEQLLRTVRSLGQDELEQAKQHEEQLLARSSLLTLAGLLAALALIIPTLVLLGRSIINPVKRACQSLDEGSLQVAAAAAQVSSSSQALAEGASEQAASIEETSASVEEMTSMSKKDADNASQADSLMREATGVIGKADESMKKLTGSMAEISEASTETQKIVKTIDEIAFQTNLLALNAAVEAARAGEAGAGFAVVADEVRNLAMRAAEAARNTSSLIEATVRKVETGGELVRETSESFLAASQATGRISAIIAEIASSASEQARAASQVNGAISQIDTVTQSNAAAAEQAASAAQELSAQAEMMKGAVRDLMALVDGGSERRERGNKPAAPLPAGRKPETGPKPGRPAPKTLPSPPARKQASTGKQERPEEMIPFDDEEFEDF